MIEQNTFPACNFCSLPQLHSLYFCTPSTAHRHQMVPCFELFITIYPTWRGEKRWSMWQIKLRLGIHTTQYTTFSDQTPIENRIPMFCPQARTSTRTSCLLNRLLIARNVWILYAACFVCFAFNECDGVLCITQPFPDCTFGTRQTSVWVRFEKKLGIHE